MYLRFLQASASLAKKDFSDSEEDKLTREDNETMAIQIVSNPVDISGEDKTYRLQLLLRQLILEAVKENDVKVLCFVDEVLRGTNTVERIAAAPLRRLCRAQRRHRRQTGGGRRYTGGTLRHRQRVLYRPGARDWAGHVPHYAGHLLGGRPGFRLL